MSSNEYSTYSTVSFPHHLLWACPPLHSDDDICLWQGLHVLHASFYASYKPGSKQQSVSVSNGQKVELNEGEVIVWILEVEKGNLVHTLPYNLEASLWWRLMVEVTVLGKVPFLHDTRSSSFPCLRLCLAALLPTCRGRCCVMATHSLPRLNVAYLAELDADRPALRG